MACPDQELDPLVFQLQKIRMTFMNAYHSGNNSGNILQSIYGEYGPAACRI